MNIAVRLKHHIMHPYRIFNVNSIPRRLIEHTVYREIFIEQDYYWLIEGLRPDTIAIDIGAFRGETAIYFAMQDKISKVYSYELMPDNYEIAKANVENLPFKHKIEVFNQAVAETKGTVYAPKGGGDAITTIAKSGIPIQAVGLNDVLDNFKNVIIKCDVEGAEDQIFNQNVDLAQVYKIMVEYHDEKGRDKVIGVLRNCGFDTSFKDEYAKTDHKYCGIGYIYASKGSEKSHIKHENQKEHGK